MFSFSSSKFTKCIFIGFAYFICVQSLFAFQVNSLQITLIDAKENIITEATAKLKNEKGYSKETEIKNSQHLNFSKLTEGKYWIEIQAKGFKPYTQQIDIKLGKNELVIKLEIAEIVENVEIGRDKQELAVEEEVFSNFLTQAQIDALPEDPEELERELKNQFGQDAVIRVDGFTGRIPPKSQIASIKVTRSSFDAEYHQLGVTIIDVTTKSGSGKWSGSVSFNFNDESLNARNPFALRRLPTQQKRYDLFLSGPVMKNKNSLFVSVSGNNSYKDENVVAVLPSGQFRESLRSSANSIYPWIKFSQNLSKNHFLGFTYQGIINNSENNGVGGFNLAERAFDSKLSNHQFRISETGNIGKTFFNEFRLQITDENLETIPNNNGTTIIVLDAFAKGGAGNQNKTRKQGIWFSDNLLFGIGKIHAVKIGGLFEYEKRKSELANNQNGTFTFSNLADFSINKPATFTQRLGIRNVNFQQFQIGTYLQDDIRLHKSFILSLGLRHEWQNNLNDKNNFSPRLGFAWSPTKRGKTTIRGGIGVYYNWLETNNLSNVLSQGFNQPSETIIINPSYPNPFVSGTSQILPQSFWQKAENLKNPYIFLASFTVQQRLSQNASLRIVYNYERGVHLFRSRDINAPLNGIRPNTNFGRIVQIESSSYSVKNSVNLSLNGRINKDLSFFADYTLSKNTSESDGIFSLPSDNYNLRLDRSSSNIDQRHRIYASVFYKIRRNLNFSTNFTVGSPFPYTITTGLDTNRDTVFNDRPFGIARNSARGTWQKQVDASLSWTFGFVKRKEGETAVPGTVVITSAEATSGDIGIDAKHKYSVKIFATANNIFNQTNFTNFVGVQTSLLFTQPISAKNARRIDFGLRLSF
jgi:hypothetical protein